LGKPLISNGFFRPRSSGTPVDFLLLLIAKYYSRSCGSLALSGGFLAALRRFAGGVLAESYHVTVSRDYSTD